MKETVSKATVGLRTKKTHEIVAVYPHLVDGLNQEVEKKVKDWYYTQDCDREEILAHCFVDIIRENELH